MMNETTRKYIGFNDTWFWAIGIPVIGLSMPFFFFGHTIHDPLPELLANWAISFIMSISYWAVSRALIIYWRKRIPEANRTVMRIALQLGCILLSSVVIELAVKYGLAAFIESSDDTHPISGMAGTYLVILLIISIYEAIFLYMQWRTAIVEKERLQQEHLRSQLQGLRNQVNPHFLFNSLNTLMSIITDDQDLAVRYLQKLSSVFRHVLENRNEQVILIEEELKFMEDYIFLQKERFRENLQVEISIPDKVRQHAIVPLSLQILIENAIKHNVISEKRPLQIRLFLNETGKLTVWNNLQLKEQKSNSTKVGLENIQTRYGFFTDASVDIESTDAYFSVSIPILSISNQGANAISDR